MKALFQDNPKSYTLVTALGLLAGLSVVFFIELPDNSVWSFYYWSSSTFEVWMFSTSLIVLYSENRKCAAINVGIYIFLMFFITTAHQSFRFYRSGTIQFPSLSEFILNHIRGWLLYSVPPALCRIGNYFMVRQEKYDLGQTSPNTASSIFICRNSFAFL